MDTNMPGEILPPTDQRRIRYDPTVNLGHLLTFAGFIITIIVGWSSLDRRVTVNEQLISSSERRGTERESQTEKALDGLRSDMKELQRSVNDVNRTLAMRKP